MGERNIARQATLLGMSSILIWGAFTGMIRSISEVFGVTLGAALIYSTASIVLLLSHGLPNIKRFPKKYLYIAGPMLIIYEVLLSLSVGLADSRHQSIEIALVNYLWPTLIVLFSLLILRVRLSWLAIPGIFFAFFGVIWALSGDAGIDIPQFYRNVMSNPLPYFLAFIAANLWAIYCNIAKLWGAGENAIPLFFTGVALALWLKFSIEIWQQKLLFNTLNTPFTFAAIFPENGLSIEHFRDIPFRSIMEFLLTGGLVGASYSFWERGIQHGNMMLLAVLSYFTPILSVLFSGLWLKAMPGLSFWIGVSMVTLGSFLSYLATQKRRADTSV